MKKINLKKNPRILITRADRIGDLVLSTPIFSAIKKRYPESYVACLTLTVNRQIVEGNPYLDEVILYDKDGSEKNILGQFLFARKIARKKFGTVIHLHATNRMHIMGLWAGIPARIGWNRRMPWALTRGLEDPKARGEKHEAVYNFDLLQGLDIPVPDPVETYFPVTERARKSLAELLEQKEISLRKPIYVFSPGASCPSKRWFPERFAELVDLFKAKADIQPVFTGSSADRVLVAKIQTLTRQKIFDLSGLLSLTMAGALFEKAGLVISNDSGPVHIAASVGAPVVSIFGRNQPGLSPKRWGPLGANARVVWKDPGCRICLAHQCQIHFLCLDAVSAKEVFEAAESLLTGKNLNAESAAG